VVASSALALAGALPSVAFATAPSADPLTSGVTTATIVLKSSNDAGLGALAQAHGLSRSQRLSALSTTSPSAATKASVEKSAAALGLTVDHTTAWTVAVHGPAAAVAALAHSGSAAGTSVSSQPSLAPDASTVVLGGGATLDWKPADGQPLAGQDFRNAYVASSVSPPVGLSRPVIATLQFVGWDSTELTTAAANAGLPAPAPTEFTAVSVDGASTTADDVSDSASEVALDQESIYAANPYADQRAYFAGNTLKDEIDAYYLIASDAVSARGIMALSVSWDLCEHDTSLTADALAAVHTAIAAVAAAGVTIFVASGDDGALCDDGLPGVNYPASDPLVVAVGGTTLHYPGPVETAWGAIDTTGQSSSGFSGSGGGQSSLFPRPAYQATVAPTAVGREVPDIAADGDPATGFLVYHVDPTPGSTSPSTGLFGGTSLSSPISAALMTAELGSRGVTTGGVGDIHALLYSAPATSFRDIVSGNNGAYTAVPGYDMVTGLGAPNWQALVNQMIVAPVIAVPPLSASRTVPVTVAVPGNQTIVKWATGYGTPPACGNSAGKPATPAAVTVPTDGAFTIWALGYTSYQYCLVGTATTTVDTTGPAVTLGAKASSATAKKVTWSWSTTDAVSGVASVAASVLRNGKTVWSGQRAGSGSIVLPGKLGSVYQLVVVAKDHVGNATTATRNLSVAFDDRSFTLTGAWSRANSHVAFGGSVITSVTKGAAAHLSPYGTTFTLLTRTCSTCGVVGIYVDGHHLRDVSLYSKATKAVSLKLDTFKVAKAHKFVLVVRGTKPPHSNGKAVYIDGLLAG
jgi:hypothetical protein